MTRCFSFVAAQDSYYRYCFKRAGLKSSTTNLGDGTIMHCWIPKMHNPSIPTLLLIHGFGANAMWQFNGLIPHFMSTFNVYVPDLLFFGESYTTRAERSESFQAQCVMSLMEAQNVAKMDVFGLSYGGFVAYSMAAQFKERVGRVALGCAGVCFEEKDAGSMEVFKVTTAEEAVSILLPQTPEKAREMVRLSFYKPPPSMPSCFLWDFIEDSCYRYSFTRAGLKSSTTDLGDGTIMHCWIPKRHKPSKPTLLLIHGFGANAMWQFNGLIPQFMPRFNVYVPDLLFFGESYTTRAERSESFQAQCVMSLMEAQKVTKMDVFGLSYGGFVAYSMAAQFKERVGRVALGCAGVCFEEKDVGGGGVFKVVTSIEEAAEVLIPQTPEKARQLVRLSFYKPPSSMPSCFLQDFIEVMCTDFRQEKEELIQALHKDRKMSDLPKITQPTLIIWGEHDQVFPLELAHRLERHIGDNAELVIIKNVGHALNAERPKELYKHLKSFFIDSHPLSKQASHGNGTKSD